MTTPYPGATVTIDPRFWNLQAPHRRGYPAQSPYYPAASVYYAPYYASSGGVTDANGQPLASFFQPQAPSAAPAAMGVPDLRGSPYVVIDGGAMQVDFGNGDRRTVPACAAMAAMQTPDGRPRTVFYTPPADGVILHAGATGRVLGTPGAGAQVCYEVDRYGRMVLDY